MNRKFEKVFTKAQLALSNGQDSEEIWCSYKGNIYDVSHSRMWSEGKHYEHWAGQDLTEEIRDAPHDELVLEKFTMIGQLKEKNS